MARSSHKTCTSSKKGLTRHFVLRSLVPSAIIVFRGLFCVLCYERLANGAVNGVEIEGVQ
jgi:hypothetical protein